MGNFAGMEALTRRQMDVLNFAADMLSGRGVSPTLKEIGDAFGVGIGRAQKYVRALVRKGYATVEPRRHRGLRLTQGRRAWKVRQGWQGEFEKRVGSRLQGEVDLRKIFALVREDLRAWLDVDRADLRVHDPQVRALRDAAYDEGSGKRVPAAAAGIDPASAVGRALLRRKPVIEENVEGRMPNVEGTTEKLRTSASDIWNCSRAAIPILGGNRALGVLCLEKRRPVRTGAPAGGRREPAGFDESTMARAAMAAAALAPALERGTLHADLQRGLRLQAALVALCRAVNSVHDFRTMLQKVYDVVQGLVDAPVFVISVQDDAGQWWMLLETDMVDGVRIEGGEPRKINPGNSEGLRAIRTAPYWLRHRTEEEVRALEAKGLAPTYEGFGAIGHKLKRSRSFLYVPLKTEGRMMGYLSAQSYRYNAYTIQDAENLILIGEYIGMAARNALREELARAGEFPAGRRDRTAEAMRRIAEGEEAGWRERVRKLADELAAAGGDGGDPAGRLAGN